jgi:hypothetical protein
MESFLLSSTGEKREGRKINFPASKLIECSFQQTPSPLKKRNPLEDYATQYHSLRQESLK